MSAKLRRRLAAVLIAFPCWSTAATVSWTGAELVGAAGVAFPTQAPTVAGASIQFTGSQNFQKRIEISLLPVGFFSDTSAAATITLQLNITRLSDDWDPHFVLSDGASLVGVAISDGNGANQIQYLDYGTYGVRLRVDDNIYQSPDLAIGNAADLSISFILGSTATAISADWQGVSGGYSSTRLDRTKALSFVFMTDNETPERYQINSLAITTPQAVPLPATWLLMASGAVEFGALGSRRRRARQR